MFKRPHLVIMATMALMICAVPAQATPRSSGLAGARAFAERIVATLNFVPEGQAFWHWGVQMTGAWYDPSWMQLMHENEALQTAHHVHDFFEGVDPVCNCEHPGFTYRVMSVRMRRDGMAVMRMDVFNGSDHSNFEIILRQSARGWRVYNSMADDTDWRAALSQHVACLRHARTHAQAGACN
jgi:hypothetical protein